MLFRVCVFTRISMLNRHTILNTFETTYALNKSDPLLLIHMILLQIVTTVYDKETTCNIAHNVNLLSINIPATLFFLAHAYCSNVMAKNDNILENYAQVDSISLQ